MYRGGPKQLQNAGKASPNTRCQRCLKFGHHTYQCQNQRPYVPRPSRSKQLAMGNIGRDKPSVEVPDEFKTGAGKGLADKILAAKEEERRKQEEKERAKAKGSSKRKKRGSSSSGSDSDSDSDSDSGSSSDSSSSSGSSRSRTKTRRRRRHSTSSSGSSSSGRRSASPVRKRRELSDEPKTGGRSARLPSRD